MQTAVAVLLYRTGQGLDHPSPTLIILRVVPLADRGVTSPEYEHGGEYCDDQGQSRGKQEAAIRANDLQHEAHSDAGGDEEVPHPVGQLTPETADSEEDECVTVTFTTRPSDVGKSTLTAH